jgi:hypothetical protein
MRSPDGGFLRPPPPWDPPTSVGPASNLMRFVDLTDDVAGQIVGLEELPRAF